MNPDPDTTTTDAYKSGYNEHGSGWLLIIDFLIMAAVCGFIVFVISKI